MLPRGRFLPLGSRLCRSRGFDTWRPPATAGHGGFACRRPRRLHPAPQPPRRVRHVTDGKQEPTTVNILLCGDVVGRSGRDAVRRHVPSLRREFALDLVVVNAENAAAGFGLTERLCGELYDCGVDVLTTGNHVWDQRQIIPYIDRDPCLLRPANFPKGTPGAGWRMHRAGGRSVLVVNLMGRLFMDALDDPFARLDDILAEHRL